MLMITIGLASVLGGFVMGVTGFGSGIVAMSVLPYFFVVTQAAAISNFMSLSLNIALVFHYRKAVRWRMLPMPSLFFLAGVTLSILYAVGMDMLLLKLLLGVFLIFMAVYNMLFSAKVSLKANLLTMIICSFISGICDGLFAIGGPLMVLYFLAIPHTREEYYGTIQALFMVAGVYGLLMRIHSGIFTMELLPYASLSVVGAIVGVTLGNRFVNSIDDKRMKEITYGLICVSGVMTVLTSI